MFSDYYLLSSQSASVAKKSVVHKASAPMARPAEIEGEIGDIEISALDLASRPEIRVSGRTAAVVSFSNRSSAPAARPESVQ